MGFLENGKQKPAVKNMLPPEISVQSLYFSEEADVVFFCENETLDYTERLHEKYAILCFECRLFHSFSLSHNHIGATMTQERLNQLEAENACLKAQLRAEETAKTKPFK